MRTISYSEAINEAIREEMERDASVIVIGEDVGTMGGVFGVTNGLRAKFGAERIIDTPISEAGIIGIALGAAMMGMRPIAEIMFGDFLGCAGDQLINQVAKARYMSGGKANIPLTIRVATGAPGASAAQHSQSPESWFMNIPGLKIVCPSTPADAKGLLKSIIRGEDPVLFFEHKMLYADRGSVPDEEVLIPLGQADVVRRGEDVTVIAIGSMVKKALEAADLLARETPHISCEVIDPRSLVPLDVPALVASAKKTGRVVIAHEAHKRAGPGAEIAAIMAEEALDYLDSPVKRVAARNVPLPYAPLLESFVLPDVDDIIRAVRATIR
ncbi:MAG TPA: alpha-ketoacid dehydrogenase subunit beta [Anaerolineae bacterium]|jgi:pyruvate dehydrogenase E1 component beta subunit